MQVKIQVEHGAAREATNLLRALRLNPDLRNTRMDVIAPAAPAGTLGATADVIQYIGDSVMVPVLVSALYDYLKTRRRARDGATLTLTVSVASADKIRAVRLTGSSQDVSAALKELTS